MKFIHIGFSVVLMIHALAHSMDGRYAEDRARIERLRAKGKIEKAEEAQRELDELIIEDRHKEEIVSTLSLSPKQFELVIDEHPEYITEAVDGVFETLLVRAVKQGKIAHAIILVCHGSDLNPLGEPLLLIAALNDDISMMRYLGILRGINLNFKGSDIYWLFNHPISDQVKREYFRLLHEYERGFESSNPQLCLTNGVIWRRKELVDHALDLGATINGFDCHGNTAVHWACTKAYPDMLAYLISKGADLDMVHAKNQRNGFRWLLRMHKNSVQYEGTAHYFTTSEFLPCLFLLCCEGADPDIPDEYGSSFLDWLPRQDFDDEERALINETLEMSNASNTRRKDLLAKIFAFQEKKRMNAQRKGRMIKAISIEKNLVGEQRSRLSPVVFKDYYQKYVGIDSIIT